MIDVKEKDLLELLNTLTHTQDEEGNPIPNYCFASDLTTDLDCSEEEVSKFATKNGFSIFKVFPGETLVGGYVIVAPEGTIEPVEKMYDEFYGEIPEISEMILSDDDTLVEKEDLDESKKKFKSNHMKVKVDQTKLPNKMHLHVQQTTHASVTKNGKGKGSYKRHSKHRGIGEDLDDDDFDTTDSLTACNITKEDSDAYKREVEEEARRYGATIEWSQDIYHNRQDAFWYKDICDIHYNGLVFNIFSTEDGSFYYKDKEDRIETPEEAEGLGLFTDDDIFGDDCDWGENAYFGVWIYKEGHPDDGFGAQADLDYEYETELKYVFDLDFLLGEIYNEVNDAMREAEAHLMDTEIEEDLEELDEKLDKNYLKLLARKHKKTDKKGAKGWFVNPNAGNVELNVAHFNHVAQADGGEGTVGCCEDLELDVSSPYHFLFNTTKAYTVQGYNYDNDNKPYFYARIPETAMRVSRDDYMNNKLLRRRKNKEVFNGVKKFFNEHPTAKWCIIDCQDDSRNGKFLNVYRVLSEQLGQKKIKCPKNEELDLDVLKNPKSPSHIRFEAHPRDEFMHRSRYWGGYPEFKCPKNGYQFYKSDFDKYNLCKAVKQELERFFKENPRKQYCVLLAFDKKNNGNNIDANGLFGYRLDEKVEKHDTLNPVLFDEHNQLKPDVREKLLEIAKEFTDGLKRDDIKFKLKDIKIVGSNCSYNYNPNSDIDLHLVMDTKSLKCPDNLYPLLYSAYRSLFNGKLDPTIKGIPVEIFVETDDTEDLNSVENDEEVVDNEEK